MDATFIQRVTAGVKASYRIENTDVNNDGGTGSSQSAGFLAIHLMNSLNTGGFQITSAKNAKGQMAFDFHGHYSLNNIEEVPFEVYCKAGVAGT